MTAAGDWAGADGLDEVPREEAGPALPRYPARQATKAPATAAISTIATATAILPPRRGGRGRRSGAAVKRGWGGVAGRRSVGGTGRGSGTGTRRGSGLAGGNGAGVALAGMEASGAAACPAAACAVWVGRFASRVPARPTPRGAAAGCVRVADWAVLSSARS